MKNLIYLGLVIIFLTVVVSALPDREDVRYCNGACKAVYTEDMLSCSSGQIECLANCEGRPCRNTCFKEKQACVKKAKKDMQMCQGACKKGFTGCQNNTREFDEVFMRGCDVCTCKRNGQVSCKTDWFCNRNVSVAEESCNANGGFYYPLCNGPYFDVVCSHKSYCLCGGVGEWTCGEGQECFYDFLNPNKRGGSIEGFRDLLGRNLGEVGVCAVD